MKNKSNKDNIDKRVLSLLFNMIRDVTIQSIPEHRNESYDELFTNPKIKKLLEEKQTCSKSTIVWIIIISFAISMLLLAFSYVLKGM